jgi:hypothetical protein
MPGVKQAETRLAPLAYHNELRDYLKSDERELWNWFASAQAQADYAEKLRLELLKSTYRLDPTGHELAYHGVEEAKGRLGLDIPVTLYQAQKSPQLNATLYHLPGEAHIVFSGPVFDLLNPTELKSVIGHELAHYNLWEREGGEFQIADRLLETAANDPRAQNSHLQSARRYHLYTEIFADRGSLWVAEDVNAVVSGLVKIETGLSQVNGESYLQQAGEIFSSGEISTEGLSHPEAFIRARALALWQENGEKAEEQIRGMIEGRTTLEGLDLLGQKRLSQRTRELMQALLRPKWFQTPAALGHAKMFFADFQVSDGSLELKPTDAALREYFCYLLLDFTRVDPELDEMPLAAAFDLSRRLEMEERFEKLAAKELKIKARDLRRIKEEAAELLAKAEVENE